MNQDITLRQTLAEIFSTARTLLLDWWWYRRQQRAHLRQHGLVQAPLYHDDNSPWFAVAMAIIGACIVVEYFGSWYAVAAFFGVVM